MGTAGQRPDCLCCSTRTPTLIELRLVMQVARVAVPRVIEKRNAVPWLFFVFGCLVFAWLFQSNAGYSLGVLVCGSIIVAILESAYAEMYWCTAAFAALAGSLSSVFF